MKIGDRVTGLPTPDTRSFWQRHAPRWLGGISRPIGNDGEGVIVAMASSHSEGRGTYTLAEWLDDRKSK